MSKEPIKIRVELPDGAALEVAAGTTPLKVAESLGPRLARAALAARVDDYYETGENTRTRVL